MKQILLTLSIILLPLIAFSQFSLFGVWSAENHWIHPKEYLRQDRLNHAGAGFVIGGVVTAIAYSVYEGDKRTNAPITGIMTVFVISLVHEAIQDSRPDNRFDEVDFWAGVNASILGALLVRKTYILGAKNGTVPEYRTRKYGLFGKKEVREYAMKY